MTFHLFGNILTFYGVAANNRGENQGNITTLQKLLWKGETHTVVSSEAIRWAIRYYWQKAEIPVNRVWNDDLPNEQNPHWQDCSFNVEKYIDDDLLGFFEAESAKKDTKEENPQESKSEPKGKRQKKPKPKGTVTDRRGRLDVTRAISTGIELVIWVDKGEDKAKPSLCDRITEAFADPSSINRFGALCLGESSFVRFNTILDKE